jgi:hypothetical protein
LLLFRKSGQLLRTHKSNEIVSVARPTAVGQVLSSAATVDADGEIGVGTLRWVGGAVSSLSATMSGNQTPVASTDTTVDFDTTDGTRLSYQTAGQ